MIRHTIRPRGTHDWLLIYTVGGSGLYLLREGRYASQPHDVTLYRPGTFQDYQWSPKTGRWDLLFIHFVPKDEWLPWLNWPIQGDGLMKLRFEDPPVRRRVTDCLRRMIRVLQGSQPRRQAFGQNILEEILLWCDSINPGQDQTLIDFRVRKVMEYLCQEASKPFSDDKLAHVAGLSASRLRHLFALQTGASMRDFHEAQRLQKAHLLLAQSSLTIAEVASEVGFSSPFYFSLRFKKHTGENPSAFRLRCRLDKEDDVGHSRKSRQFTKASPVT